MTKRLSRRTVLMLLAAVSLTPAAGQSPFRTRSGERDLSGLATPARFSGALGARLVNQTRQRHGSPPLSLNGTLQSMAAQQSRRLAGMKRMSHSPGPGLSLKQRAARAGYRGMVAENLAEGYLCFEDAIEAWLASSYHRPTLLAERYRKMGVAVSVPARTGDKEPEPYWTIILGT